jgi:broad specificity phosphatase PhoE
LIDRAGLEQWRDSYDSAGIQTHSRPPEPLLDIAAQATHIIASDLRRALGSAEKLAPGREIQVSDVFREAPLAIPNWPTRLPLVGWAMVIHVGWMYRIVRGTDANEEERARAAVAAELLAGIATDDSTTLVVTHGVFRRLLAAQLHNRGWAAAGRVGGYRHWSAWSFAR